VTLGTLLLPPKLVLRALDDLHTIAVVAESLNGRLDRLEARAEEIQEQLGVAIDVAVAIERRGEEVIATVTKIDARVDDVIAQAALISERAQLVATTGAEVAAALPLLQRALELTEPLEGAVERLGRVVDRLPGGRRGPAKPTATKPAG
jgi:hypothetical protein